MGGRAVLCVGRMDDELDDPGRHDEEQRGGRTRLHGLTKLRDGPQHPSICHLRRGQVSAVFVACLGCTGKRW